jgi:hypothetical protein
LQQVVKQMSDVGGSKLDAYEVEADGENIYTLQDLTEFQLGVVRQRLSAALLVSALCIVQY